MAQWDELSPGRGSTASVNDAAAKAGKLSTSTETVHTALKTASTSTTTDVWSGGAGDSFRSSLLSPRSLCSELTIEFSAVQSALTAYAAEVDRIRLRANEAHSAHSAALAVWKADQNAQQAQQAQGPFVPTFRFQQTPQYLSTGLWVPYGSDPGAADMATAAQALRSLVTARESADNALIAALQPPSSSRWDQMQAALRAVGLTSADDLTNSSIADAFANLTEEMLEGKKLSEEDVKALQSFFDAWGDDHSVMAQYFLEIGGGDTAELINQLGINAYPGDLPAAAALALATAVRSGLSVGSEHWSPSNAGRFADEMLSNASSMVGGLVGSIGFLFSNPAGDPLGVELTVAMADRIDKIERDPSGFLNGSWTDSSPHSGGRVLAFLEAESTGLSGARVNDLAGRIFSTLGVYPEAALDWLTSTKDDPFGDGDLGAGRIEYWYGERDWSANWSGDGFEGPGALWAGAQQVAGGPTDASGYDPDAWERVARMTTSVVDSLLGNESFLPENLSSIGQVRIAEAISLSMPLFSENISGYDPSTAGDSFLMDQLFGTNDLRAIPNVTMDQLSQLLGTATWSDGETPSAGAAVIGASVQSYQDALLAAASLAAPDSAFTAEALQRVVELQGWLDGSGMGAALGEASRHDAAVQSAIDGVSTVVGMIPIPGVGDLLVAGGSQVIDIVQDAAIGQLMDYGSDQAAAAWGASHDALLEQYANSENPRELATKDAIRQMLDQLGVTESLGSEGNVNEYIKGLMADYKQGTEAHKSWAEGDG